MPRTRTGTHTLCASLRSRNKLVSFTRAIYTEMYRENAAPKNRDTHFVRACAVEMHLKISQEPLQKISRPSWSTLTGTRTFCRAFEVEMHRKISQEPRYTEISRENAAPQNRDTHTHFVRACPVEMRLEISQEPLYTEMYRKISEPSWGTWSSTRLYPQCGQCSGKKRPYPHHTIPQLWETGTASRKQPSSRFTRLGWHINIKLPDDKSTKHSKATKCLQKSRGILR